MRKKSIQLGVLLLLLVAAVAGYLALNTAEPAAQESSAVEEVYALGGIPQPFVKEVSVRNGLGSFRILNGYANAVDQLNNATQRGYSMEGMDNGRVVMSMLQSVVNTAASLPARKVVDAAGADLSAYGLDAPVATVDIVYDTGDVQMKIGGNAPGNEGTYVLVADTVYLVGSTRLSNFLGSRLSFVDKAMTSGSLAGASFTRAELSGIKYPQPIVIEQDAGTGNYRIKSPIAAGTDYNTGIIKLLSVFGLSATQVVGVTADGLDVWGLAEPYAITDIHTDNEEVGSFTLSISSPDAEGNVFATVSGSGYIYQLPLSAMPWVDLDLFDYQSKMVLQPAIDNVATVEVRTSEAAHTFTLTGEKDGLAVSVDGKALDTENFREFYRTLISAAYDEAIPEAESSEAGASAVDTEVSRQTDIVLQYTYTYRDGRTPDVITFRPGAARRLAVSLNGGREYLCKSTYVDRVLQDLPQVLAGQPVKSI